MPPLHQDPGRSVQAPNSSNDKPGSGQSSFESTHQTAWMFRAYQSYGENPPSYGIPESFVACGAASGCPSHLIGDTLHPTSGTNTTGRARARITSNCSEPDLPSPALTLSPVFDRYWGTGPADQPYYDQFDKATVHNPSSPTFSNDESRKKNTKFEIPDGRTLDTLDALIARAKDDDEMKELKAQKRLLKNREAALQSRQRKKQHTENLEGEKKQYMHVMAQYEERLAAMTGDNEKLIQDKLDLQRKTHRTEKRVQELDAENNRLCVQIRALQQSLMGFQYNSSAHHGNSSSYADLNDVMHLSPVSDNDWGRFIDSPLLGTQNNTAPRQETTRTLPPVEHLRASTHQRRPVDSDDSRMLLFLIAAGASMTANPSPEKLAAFIESGPAHAIRGASHAVMESLLGGVSPITNTSKITQAQYFGSSCPTLGPQSREFLKFLQDSVKQEVMDELRALIQTTFIESKIRPKR